jgi:RNA polymerase sigma factor (TIGR02999 family)
MTVERRERITAVLETYLDTGSAAIADELMGLVYDDLRRLASRLLRGERRGHTLSPTDLVHEAYTKMVDQTRVDWRGRTHFFAVAAQAMRRILIDYARRHGRQRHGGDWKRVTLDIGVAEQAEVGLEAEELLSLDAALDKLAALDAREAQVVELRFFVGLSNEEIARYLGVSTRSVTRDWLHARSWLRRELALGVVPIGDSLDESPF